MNKNQKVYYFLIKNIITEQFRIPNFSRIIEIWTFFLLEFSIEYLSTLPPHLD